jgi:hypothetical protein
MIKQAKAAFHSTPVQAFAVAITAGISGIGTLDLSTP